LTGRSLGQIRPKLTLLTVEFWQRKFEKTQADPPCFVRVVQRLAVADRPD